MIIVDTREPEKYILFLRKTFPDMVFERFALKEGDYASERCLVERKTIPDLYGSIMGPNRRIQDQIERISVHSDKVQVLLITGSVAEFVKGMADPSIHVKVDPNVLFGEIASIACRYGIQPLWIENEWEAMITMVKFMSKVDQGKWMVPVRRDPEILAAKLLGISVLQLKTLMMKHKCLHTLASVPDKDLMTVKGIGPAKAQNIKSVLLSGL